MIFKILPLKKDDFEDSSVEKWWCLCDSRSAAAALWYGPASAFCFTEHSGELTYSTRWCFPMSFYWEMCFLSVPFSTRRSFCANSSGMIRIHHFKLQVSWFLIQNSACFLHEMKILRLKMKILSLKNNDLWQLLRLQFRRWVVRCEPEIRRHGTTFMLCCGISIEMAAFYRYLLRKKRPFQSKFAVKSRFPTNNVWCFW